MDLKWFGFLLRLYELVIFIRVILSWVQVDWNKGLPALIRKITDPVLVPIRSIVPGSSMGIDLSPMIVILILELLISLFK